MKRILKPQIADKPSTWQVLTEDGSPLGEYPAAAVLALYGSDIPDIKTAAGKQVAVEITVIVSDPQTAFPAADGWYLARMNKIADPVLILISGSVALYQGQSYTAAQAAASGIAWLKGPLDLNAISAGGA